MLVVIAWGLPLQSSQARNHAASEEIREPVVIDDPRDNFDVAVGLAQVAAALVTLGSVLFLVLQLRAAKEQVVQLNRQTQQTREEARIQRSLTFQERFTGREFRVNGSVVLAYLDVEDGADAVEKMRAWHVARHAESTELPRSPRDPEAPGASKNDVLQFFDFFEALGTAYNENQIDQDALLRSFGSTPAHMLNMGWWFLCWRRMGRSLDETRLYTQFQLMVDALRHAEPDIDSLLGNVPVRVLAVPADEDDMWDWHVCGRFCDLISRRIASGDASLDDVTVEATTVALEFPRHKDLQFFANVIFVPDHPFEDPAVWRKGNDDAKRLRHQVRGLDAVQMDGLIDELQRRWSKGAT